MTLHNAVMTIIDLEPTMEGKLMMLTDIGVGSSSEELFLLCGQLRSVILLVDHIKREDAELLAP